jgi:DNA-binding transcriptional ArsR family regulator
MHPMEELDPVFDKVARYFALLSDPSRLKVIHAICSVECSVNEVVVATGLTQSTVSRHLKSLHDSGVASRRKQGTLALYAVIDSTLTDICRTACVNLLARENVDSKTLSKQKKRAAQFMALAL